MRRSLLLLVLAAVSIGAFAQGAGVVFEKPFKPMSPVVVGQGGSFTANGSGWDAFFTNPAALAGANSFTLVSANPWVYTTGDMLTFVLQEIKAAQSGGQSARVTGPSRMTVTLPPGVEYPAGVSEGDLATLVAQALADAGLSQAAIDSIGTVVVPVSWIGIDPTTLTSDPGQLQQYVGDFFAANPLVEQALAAEIAATMLPPGFPSAPRIRVGTAAGLGLIVKGFGLGVAAIVDASIDGNSILSMAGDVTATVGFMAGYAYQFKLSDSIGLKVGGLLRPMFRVRSGLGGAEILSSFGSGSFDPMTLLNSVVGFYGTGIGIDVGAILGVGPFSVGIAATDLFDTKFNYQASPLMTLYETAIATQSLPMNGSAVSAKHVIPMDVRVGAAFHPDLGGFSFLIDPSISMEIGNFLTLAREAAAAQKAHLTYKVTLGDIAAFGAEVRLLRFLKVRAGYYRGALSAGIGAKILFLDANVAAYVAPKSGSVGNVTGTSDLGDVGVAAEFALRF